MGSTLLMGIVEEIKRKFNVEYEEKIEDFPFKPRKSNVYIIEGVKNEEFVTFIIYDCYSEGKFDYKTFFDIYDSISEASIEIVMIFDDWIHEYKLYEDCYKTQTEDNKQKIRLTGIFEQKTSYYAQSSEPVKLVLQNEGINYLEYNVNEYLECISKGLEPVFDNDKEIEGNYSISEKAKQITIQGRIYNLQMSEIQKLYYVTGKDLFIKNIRLGIEEKNIVAKKIKDSFKSYFQVYCYNKLSDDKKKSIAKNIWKLTNEILQENIPQKFWYYHNGITFFVEQNDDDKDLIFETMGSIITVNPKKVSVINGAQTLTNIFYGIQEVLGELNDLIDNLDEPLSSSEKGEIINLFSVLIKESLTDIYVKAIFIEANPELSDAITRGLNTQIPILEEDSLAASKEIMRINEALYKRNMKVLKVGEKEGTKRGLDVLTLCKLFLTTKEDPGKSKNFPKNEMKSILNEIIRAIKENETKFLDNIETSLNISDWWPSRKKIIQNLNENKSIIEKYGRNYFQSYFLFTTEERGTINDEILIQIYTKFLDEFSKGNVSLGEFKKSQLFEDFKNTYSKVSQDSNISSLSESDLSDLTKYLNDIILKNEKQKRAINYLITKYFLEKNINLSTFRTIPLIKEKDKKYSVKEAFPFSSNTFNSLYQGIDYLNINKNIKYPTYEKSDFKKAVNEVFPIFIIYWNGENSEIDDIKYYKEFSFGKFNKEAEYVYGITIKSFENGDYNLFPKVSQQLKFHIRPKAMNANDQFMFSSGEFITKRTFWANRETVYEVLDTMSLEDTI